jgi:hypothetical protein
LAVLGLWYNSITLFADYSSVLSDLGREKELGHFYTALHVMSATCIAFFLSLLVSGIQLVRKKVDWAFVLAGVIAFEIVYFLLVTQLWTSSTYGYSVAAATGVANGGLMFQAFTLYPVWALPVAFWARHKKIAPISVS